MLKKTLAVLAAILIPVTASAMTADEIVNKANLASYYAGKSGRSDVKMTITDSRGRTRNREFRILRLNESPGGEQKYYVYFKKPADVAKMVYMVWKHVGTDDDRWLYMPALDLVKRIAAKDKRSAFVGSHFVYEDVSGRAPSADKHELVGEENNAYKIINTPLDKDEVDFATYTVWIDKNNFMPLKAEYLDENGELIRSVEALEIKDINGYPTVTKSLAKDVKRNGQTTMDFENVEYDIGIDDNVFTERYLRRAPAKWIR